MENISDKARRMQVSENLHRIRAEIAEAAIRSGRKPEDITLLAATKTVPTDIIEHAVREGISVTGENRVQELCDKYDALRTMGCGIQMIGHLQTNKVRAVCERAELIQSVDSLHLAEEINRVCTALGKQMPIFLEVNIGREAQKSGVMPENLAEICCQIAQLPALKITGLMAIPPICENEAEIRKYFAQMRHLFLDIQGKKMDNISMCSLSMGMSGDFVPAILEGATMVRVGSALFGARAPLK